MNHPLRGMSSLPKCALLVAVSLGGISCNLMEDNWRPIVPDPQLSGSLSIPDTRAPVTEDSPLLPPYPDVSEDGPLNLTVEEAVLLAVENNPAIRVERLSPVIEHTFVEQELAAFDPLFLASPQAGRGRTETRWGTERRSSLTGLDAGIEQFFPTGTTLGVSVATERTWGDGAPQQHETRAGVSVTQSLLRGAGVAVNLANLRQERLDALYSEYEFRAFAENLVADVETTYWQYVLARRQVEIVQESLTLAEKQLADTNHRIRVGDLAETERAAAEAEVALRRESLINSNSEAASLKVQLLRLMVPRVLDEAPREIIPLTHPTIPPVPVENVADHIAVALRMRSDLNQARIELQRGDIEIVKTRNGLLPKMDLFITLGKTGYANSFGESLRDIGSDGYDMLVAVELEYPVHNRDARAQHRRALVTREQKAEALKNVTGLVFEDVQLACIEVERTRQQVDATAVTRKSQEEKLRAETAKFRVGKSTALLVAAVQRGLLESQVAEVEAVTNYINSRINLYLLEGSLLERRGLAAPGREPAKAKDIPIP